MYILRPSLFNVPIVLAHFFAAEVRTLTDISVQKWAAPRQRGVLQRERLRHCCFSEAFLPLLLSANDAHRFVVFLMSRLALRRDDLWFAISRNLVFGGL
jgi:hypothetical protein